MGVVLRNKSPLLLNNGVLSCEIIYHQLNNFLTNVNLHGVVESSHERLLNFLVHLKKNVYRNIDIPEYNFLKAVKILYYLTQKTFKDVHRKVIWYWYISIERCISLNYVYTCIKVCNRKAVYFFLHAVTKFHEKTQLPVRRPYFP